MERAADWCRRVAAVSESRGLQPLINVCRIQYAGLRLVQGDWVEAERELVAALDRLAGSRRASRLDAVVILGELRHRQGRYDEAEELLGQAEFVPAAAVSRAMLRFARGEAEPAWQAVRAVLDDLPRTAQLDRAAALPSAVVVALGAGDRAAAEEAAAELREIAEETGTDRLLGQAAAARAQLTVGPESGHCWREAARHFNRAGLRFDEAEARLGLARAILADHDRAGAEEHLARAALIFAELGTQPQLAAIRELAGPSGERGPLSPRQIEVVALVARGMSNAEIARSLHLSTHTVHRHVANILAALGLNSRAAATAYAVRAGLVAEDGTTRG